VIFSWLRRRRRKKLLAQQFPDAWREILAQYPFYGRLDEGERSRLHDVLRVLVAEKNWEGCYGLELTDEIRVTVAGLAALLVMNIEHDYFERVTSILVYPTTYPSVFPHRDGAGVVSEDAPMYGEAWYRGPVLLAWDEVRQGALDPKDGSNLVLHEFAHRLDMLDGYVDGTPPLGLRERYADWARVMTEEFEALVESARRGRRSVLDPYGATNEAEFFAVAVEAFFEKPRQMQGKHAELYDLLRAYFRQDPLERLRRSVS
jgi:Mlc titration factor MtfA (ptsG expression regulator)